MKKAVVIVEAISTGVFYEQDILDRGYQPLVIYRQYDKGTCLCHHRP